MTGRSLSEALADATEVEAPPAPEASDVRERMLKLAERLFTGGDVSSAYIRRRFGVSLATAKRDLVVIEQTIAALVSFEPGNLIHGKASRVKKLRLMPTNKGSL